MIGDNLKLYLAFKNWTGADLARITGIKSGPISLFCNNKRDPGAEQLALIASFTDLNIHWLVTGEGPMLRYDYDVTGEPVNDGPGLYQIGKGSQEKQVLPMCSGDPVVGEICMTVMSMPSEARVLVKMAAEILSSDDRITKDALTTNLVAFHRDITRYGPDTPGKPEREPRELKSPGRGEGQKR